MTATSDKKVEPVVLPKEAARPDHPDHDRWVVETLVEDDADYFRSVGLEPNVEVLRKEWAETKTRLDRKAREPKKPRREPKKRNNAERLAAQSGSKLVRKTPVKPNQLRQHPTDCQCRRCKRESRIKTLLAKAPRKKRIEFTVRGRRCVRYEDAWEPLFPAFEREIIQVWADCHADRGEFLFCRNEQDKARLITRKFEDIADRSRAILGEWM